ncbi:uncharacterized protein LOC125178960 [Hyalella azteca]|uniref:Uncharacterized protein LOC125178960 n=1 Tax=Hyalella azteca TaxID=294128 RepID=A0A979FUZ9_HYAAZ|nr:uncharacterized protein LOC125178960 [Hyalella azteca]
MSFKLEISMILCLLYSSLSSGVILSNEGVSFKTVEEACIETSFSKLSLKAKMACARECHANSTCSAFCHSAALSSCYLNEIRNLSNAASVDAMKSYLLVSSSLNYSLAQAYCANLGGYLAFPMGPQPLLQLVNRKSRSLKQQEQLTKDTHTG